MPASRSRRASTLRVGERRGAGDGRLDDALALVVQAPQLGGDLRQQLDPATPDEQQHQVAGATGDARRPGPAPRPCAGRRTGAPGRPARASTPARRDASAAVSRAPPTSSSESSRSAMEAPPRRIGGRCCGGWPWLLACLVARRGRGTGRCHLGQELVHESTLAVAGHGLADDLAGGQQCQVGDLATDLAERPQALGVDLGDRLLPQPLDLGTGLGDTLVTCLVGGRWARTTISFASRRASARIACRWSAAASRSRRAASASMSPCSMRSRRAASTARHRLEGELPGDGEEQDEVGRARRRSRTG